MPPGWEYGRQIANTGWKKVGGGTAGGSISRELIKRITNQGRRGNPACHTEFMALLGAVAPGDGPALGATAVEKLAEDVRRCLAAQKKATVHRPTTNYHIMKALKPKR